MVFSKDFHKDLDVDGSLKGKAWDFVRKLNTDSDLTGLDFKQPQGAIDKRVRTARVDLNYRAVLFDMSVGGEAFYLLAGIKKHDDAYRLAETIELRVNPVNGIAEVLRHQDVARVSKPETLAKRRQDLPRLLPFSVAEIVSLGVLEQVAERIVEITDEDDLQELCLALPEWQGDALLQLAYGTSLDDVRKQYGPSSDRTTGGIEADDFGTALQHPASRMQFVVVTDDNDDELRAMLESDFSYWRTFLHPEQRSVAYREQWNGSFRLSGGAGTGKTVAAIHRASFLASRSGGARVLLTTFTKTLATQLQGDLAQLAGPARVNLGTGAVEPGTVRVMGVDSLARQMVARADGHVPRVIPQLEEDRLWEQVVQDLPDLTPDDTRMLTPGFLAAEYRNVILAQEITDRQHYLKAPRRGRGVRLNWLQRKRIWEVVDLFQRRLLADGKTTFAALVARAAEVLAGEDKRDARDLFDHVVVDEGQDLSASHWLMLRRLVPKGANDLFICEDSHQRVYGERLVLGHFGIDVRGRSRKLTLNYRTTRQNLRFGLRILDGGKVVDLQGDEETRVGYRSRLSGPEPILHSAASTADEADFIVRTIRDWLTGQPEGSLKPGSIGVLVRTNRERDDLVHMLRQEGVPAETLTSDADGTGKGVRVATMHRAKGMEFARVLVAGVSESTVPLRWLLDNAAVEDRPDVEQRERLLLYVACTRARDQLVVTWHGRPSPYLPLS
ncbi:3'-5' exonuclease [Actinosynnema sp. NPDC023587]|uniref:3'-5' exonuclease n=1 Tax=Actinosynnema sp. NPDC023587 TaxID=3154695 RepID=UPI0033F842DD